MNYLNKSNYINNKTLN